MEKKNLRNEAFFSLYELVFRKFKSRHGELEAIEFAREIFSSALGPAYKNMGFTQGSVKDFIRCVSERDNAVGLAVEVFQESEIIRYITVNRRRGPLMFFTNSKRNCI